ncbi:GNAT family N-acetyltransferase [Streptacidiphilus sp. NEAU-YB345]|uniref:GNAT family N-acetyltransferase n=1 Tax=Streptacidiphilus fuscans TaxID=2789292 RepID=A0A931BBZ2_9ACTN|nr:GNAT family N-acetyltransferase [Streptacidiphilus fuscans]
MEPVEIVSARYRLRPPSLREARDVLAMAQDPEIRLWNGLTTVSDEDSARAWCERWSGWNGGTSAVWGVFDAAEPALLATISLSDIDRRNSSAEIGYRVAPWARGQGVATAALMSVTDWAFATLDLTRLQLLHGRENHASCRVAVKAGFVLEGELRSSYRYGDGELHDEHLHARLAGDRVAP